MPNRLILAGSVMLALGMLVAVLAAGVAGGPQLTVHAGQSTADPTSDPDPTVDPCVEIDSFGVQQPPDCNPPGPGPRLTPSAAATNTPAPEPTQAPPTIVPTATSPTGGAGAGGVQPPNTGDGSGTRGASGSALLGAGLLLTLGGGSLVTLGARRRS
ncbi:MAG TPA: hypothetical protein VFH62_00360 [Dehalococcoidia bacterium]|nr:hypothetical protein [Dehalococcoidia bacterium]